MKTESYTPGDILKPTDKCRADYPKWKVSQGTIVSAKMKMLKNSQLQASERAMYQTRYGLQESYPIFEFIIDCDGIKNIVSQFHFNKD